MDMFGIEINSIGEWIITITFLIAWIGLCLGFASVALDA